MNDHLYATASQQQAFTLLAIRKSQEWKATHKDWKAYVEDRWSLSKTRAEFLCKFANFCNQCRQDGLDLPETPENIRCILSLPVKKWIDAWSLVLDCSYDQIAINDKHCKSVLDRFGIFDRKRLSDDAIAAIRVRRAAKTLADFEDGEKLAQRLGPKGFGVNWDKAVEVAIDADQARLDAETR